MRDYGFSLPLVTGAVDMAGIAMPVVGADVPDFLLPFIVELWRAATQWLVAAWCRTVRLIWCVVFAEAGDASIVR